MSWSGRIKLFCRRKLTKGRAAQKPEAGLEESFSMFFTPDGYSQTLSQFPDLDSLYSYWSSELAPISKGIENYILSNIS